VDLWLWGRGSLEDLTVDGDRDIAATLRRAAEEETQ
jgi:hypothetical protein